MMACGGKLGKCMYSTVHTVLWVCLHARPCLRLGRRGAGGRSCDVRTVRGGGSWTFGMQGETKAALDCTVSIAFESWLGNRQPCSLVRIPTPPQVQGRSACTPRSVEPQSKTHNNRCSRRAGCPLSGVMCHDVTWGRMTSTTTARPTIPRLKRPAARRG